MCCLLNKRHDLFYGNELVNDSKYIYSILTIVELLNGLIVT